MLTRDVCLDKEDKEVIRIRTGTALAELCAFRVLLYVRTVCDVADNLANALLVGCSTTEPTPLPASAVHVTETASFSDVSSCRSDCFRRRRNIVIFRSGQVGQLLLLLLLKYHYHFIKCSL